MIKSRFNINRERAGHKIRHAAQRHHRFIRHFNIVITNLQLVIRVLAVIASLFCLIELTLFVGFDRNASEVYAIKQLLRIPQGIFILNIVFGILTTPVNRFKNAKILKWIVNAAILITAAAWAYPRPDNPWIKPLCTIVYSNTFLFSVLACYSLFELCHCVIRLIGRRTNPALILSGSFIVFIIIGSFLLMLPKCTSVPLDYSDSLFVATSAVCITGLTTVDIPTTFTPLGLIILSSLIQVGGLGVITFTSFFAIFFSGTPSIYSQLMIKDMVYSKTINNLIPTLLYILAFTLTVEAIGAIAVYFTIPPQLGLTTTDKMMFACFHSLSSFCNAGFSCLPGGMANQTLMNGSQSIYIVTSILIFAGAVGFPILVNFKDIFTSWIRRIFTHRSQTDNARQVHIYDLNTKLVLVTTLTILAVCSVAFFIFEFDNTLSGMPIGKKITQSVFNSLIPRSAGFTTVNPSMFLPATMLIIIVQMWIGGASQSLAGGVKVNTFAAVILNLRATIRGNSSATAFGRRISVGSIRRANAVVAISIGAVAIYSLLILLLEPQLSVKAVLFEVTSAFFTVGSSLGITPELGVPSKLILSTAMFAGRVGILSILVGVASQAHDRSVHYPTDNIIIS